MVYLLQKEKTTEYSIHINSTLLHIFQRL